MWHSLYVPVQDSYWMVLHDEIIEVISSRQLSEPSSNAYRFQMFNFATSHKVVGEQHCSYVLALCHAVWQHASIGQLSVLPGWVLDFLCVHYTGISWTKYHFAVYNNQKKFFHCVIFILQIYARETETTDQNWMSVSLHEPFTGSFPSTIPNWENKVLAWCK